MSETDINRRQFGFGIAAAGVAAVANGLPASAQAVLSPKTVMEGFQPCRFGQVHYRYVRPAAATRKLPLLCLHASPGSSVIYTDFLKVVGTDRFAFAADTPGYGLSDRPANRPGIADYAAAMGDMLDAMGLKRIDLLGNHTSSATAIELARQRPGLVRRIVLNSALMFTAQDRAAFRANTAKGGVPDLDDAAAKLPELWRNFRTYRAEMGDERAWQLFWDMNRDPLHRDWGYTASYDYDFAPSLAQIKQPMLILNAKDMLAEITARAKGVVPNGRIYELPWSSSTFGVHSAEVGHIVRAFLDT